MNREEILSRYQSKVKKLTLADGSDFYIKSMPIEEAEASLKATTEKASFENLLSTFIRSACDENGTRLFTEADRPALRTLELSFITEVVRAANILNGVQAPETTAKN